MKKYEIVLQVNEIHINIHDITSVIKTNISRQLIEEVMSEEQLKKIIERICDICAKLEIEEGI